MKIPKFKIDIVQNIIIGALAILLLLSNFSIVAQFLGKLNPLASYQRQIDDLKQRVLVLEFDRVRIEDVSNLLLALQDYNFDTGSFPLSLEELKDKGYLGKNRRLIDPGTNQPYFYQKRENDFVLCVWLSDMIKGVNTANCPSDFRSTTSQNNTPTVAPTVQNKEQKLKIIGNTPYVNVREQPTTNSSVVARVIPGEEYVFTKTEGDWYYIIVNSAKEGWVRNDYASPIPTE